MVEQVQELLQATGDSVWDTLGLSGQEAVRCSTGVHVERMVEPYGMVKAAKEEALAESMIQVEDAEAISRNLSRSTAEVVAEGCFEAMTGILRLLVPVGELLAVQELHSQCLSQSTEYSCSRRETLSPATREAWRYPRR